MRVLVGGPQDLAAVHRLHDAMQLHLRDTAPAATAGLLTAPEGPFRLMLRVYRPAAALLEPRAPLPQVQQAPC